MSYGYPPDPSLPPSSGPHPDFESVYLAAVKAVDALNSDEGLVGSELQDLRRRLSAYEEGR